LEEKRSKVSTFYNATIRQLLDAYIYKGDYDKEYIESLLDKVFNDPSNKHYSYVLYVNYIFSLKKNDPAIKRIFSKFRVKDFTELFDFITKDSKGIVNNNALINLYFFSSNVFFKNEQYDQAFKYLKKANVITKQIYSEELAQTLAAFESNKVREQKEIEISREKEKNKTYFIFIIITIGFLIFSVVLIFIIRSKRAKLAEKNKENELLLKEINHRVKNNFQTISSLLELQSRKVTDEGFKEILKEGQNRINSLSLIHKRLYQNNEVSTICFQDYCKELINQNVIVYKFDKINLDILMKNILLDIDTAIPLGLILNELSTNTFKYAFDDKNNCQIKITLDEIEVGEYKLTYRDNGKGLPADMNWSTLKSLGLVLIKRLTKQLHGQMNYFFDNGAVFEITFIDTQRRSDVD